MAKYIVLLLTLVTILALSCSRQTGNELEQLFADPPESTKPWVYWYWISDNISKEGISKDLEAMAKVGIGEALIGNILDESVVRGDVKVLSDEWWGMVAHAIREADRLGIKVGLFNCPGWSQSGGPWIKAEQAMRYLVTSELRVKGPVSLSKKLAAPADPFQQVAVLAFPAPEADQDHIAGRDAKIKSSPVLKGIERLFDGDQTTSVSLEGYPLTIDLELTEPMTVRSLQIFPVEGPISAVCELQMPDSAGGWRTITTRRLDRDNLSVAVGPMVFAPAAESFSSVTSARFRIMFSDGGQSRRWQNDQRTTGRLAEIELSASARLSRYIEKQLAKMHPTPYIAWDTYLWPEPAEPEKASLTIAEEKIVDLTGKVSSDGTLAWDVPAGDWIIVRTGMTPTGTRNAPTTEEGRGYEVDKMNKEAAQAHFDAYAGKILSMLSAHERNGIRHLVADSYEQGSENWTEGFAEHFREVYGYDPVRWLPVLTGRIIESADRSERFLWDLRRLVADRIASGYVAGLREKCEENGIRLWLENYGHWGFPGEFLCYGGASHDLGGEFWLDNIRLGAIECRCASSAAHIYGKNVVSAEAFTAANAFRQTPHSMKARGDWAFTEGINHFVLHVYIHQPWDERRPGMNAWFGTDFNRHSTWFFKGKAYMDYVRRAHALLQQGRNVADIAYFIGEDAPKMTGAQNPPRPNGYNYDYINGEVLLRDAQVKNGRIVLPGGASYRILVLPDQVTMRPELLAKLKQLVKEGATILGPAPQRSPSMKNFPACDEQVRSLAQELWGDCDGKSVTERTFGKGRLFSGITLQDAFARLQIVPDVVCGTNYLWTHRQTGTADIYFVTNQAKGSYSDTLSFRVTGKQPELWDAVSGEIRDLPVFQEANGLTRIPLRFDEADSWFIVFRRRASSSPGRTAGNFPQAQPVMELSAPWKVSFNGEFGTPQKTIFETLHDWTSDSNPAIKYFSGTAVYEKEFAWQGPVQERCFLDLGLLESMATVKLNGKELATVWRVPYRVDISKVLKQGQNAVEIEVTNSWWNRVVGDAQPGADRYTWAATTVRWNANSELMPAGLLGPVRIMALKKDE